ncbi:hypothetical protein [Erythrobacter sp. JK5]|uniref:hypothetical protein n=1 Tax=Erythrobacter sp. JK5 TaxID=2829500 RepID=UPI001BA66A27|nr:hypothetical protein [Erythrobacter sp. JK5]QUL37571.1 hypothetical protein KDC96_14680 [Erythrobacter sp. JK5]
MKRLVLSVASATMIIGAVPAHAQSFTYDITWQPVESVGGIDGMDGPQYQGGSVNGTWTTTYEDGSKDSGTLRCVGMDQPDGGVFAIHLTCNIKGSEGTATSVYGCNFLGPRGPDTPLGCVGGLQGREGPFADRRGGLTMEWYSDTKSRGTGQWYSPGQP